MGGKMWRKGGGGYTKNRDLKTWMDGGGSAAVPVCSENGSAGGCPKMRGLASRAGVVFLPPILKIIIFKEEVYVDGATL